VINDVSGRPKLHLPDDILAQLSGARCHLSISHERQFAAAVAIFTEDE
jgi:phosphopantetheinyl transferase (holo-ACP synthase)